MKNRKTAISLCLGVAVLLAWHESVSYAQSLQQISPDLAKEMRANMNARMNSRDGRPMPSIAPLFLEDSHFSTTLYLANDADVSLTGRLQLNTVDGVLIEDRQVTVAAHDKAEIPIKSLLTSSNLNATAGSLELYEGDITVSGIVGQVVITHHGQNIQANIDEELLMPPMEASNNLRGIATGAAASPIVAVSNTSEYPIEFAVNCAGESAPAVEHMFQVDSHRV